jgi:hypothetical protein
MASRMRRRPDATQRPLQMKRCRRAISAGVGFGSAAPVAAHAGGCRLWTHCRTTCSAAAGRDVLMDLLVIAELAVVRLSHEGRENRRASARNTKQDRG